MEFFMKKNVFRFVCMSVLSLAMASSLLAHEGHKEASLKSMHGGIVKKTTNTFIEVVQLEGEVQIYVRDHDNNAVDGGKLTLTGEFKDSKKKIEALNVKYENGKYFKVLNNTKNQNFFSVLVKMNGKHKNINITNEQAAFNLENIIE